MRLSRSVVGEAEAAALTRVVMEDGYLGMGGEVQAFEQELAGYLGVEHDQVTCVSSGTAALQLALEAVIQSGDGVLVPSLTYVASFQAITAAGGQPIACDVDTATGLINLEDAATRIDSNTTAIMPVHYASHPGDPERLEEFSRRHGLRVVADAAHSFGCRSNGRLVGSYGDITCFSFDGIKNITSGEGGAVVTADREVARLCRDARLLGVEKDTEARFAGRRSWEFEVTRQGWRYHMSNLFAAIGREQLRRFEVEFAPRRVQLSAWYRAALGGIDGVEFFDTQAEVVPHILPIRVLNGRREAVVASLEADGIGYGIHYKPNHLLERFAHSGAGLPVCEALYGELVSLPLHPLLKKEDAERAVAAVTSGLKGAGS